MIWELVPVVQISVESFSHDIEGKFDDIAHKKLASGICSHVCNLVHIKKRHVFEFFDLVDTSPVSALVLGTRVLFK